MANEATERGDYIDSAVDAASGTNDERDAKVTKGIKGVTADENPNKPGGALARAWERKRQAGTLIAQEDG